jgi:hypothetical protein
MIAAAESSAKSPPSQAYITAPINHGTNSAPP